MNELQIPLLTGAAELMKFRRPDSELMESHVYNSAYLLVPHREPPDPYRKRLLVPFGEYLPLKDFWTWPQWLVPARLTVTPGEAPGRFELPDGTRFSVVICWENQFPDFVRESLGDGTAVLVHLSNMGWAGDSPAARQQNLATVMRGVENGVPVVIASNNGPSQIVDAFGRVHAEHAALLTSGVVRAPVPQGKGSTLYTRFGDVFTGLCALVLGLAFVGRASAKAASANRHR